MTTSIFLTVPVAGGPDVKEITPTSDSMSLKHACPELIYGFHGHPNAKATAMARGYADARAKGLHFHLIDLIYTRPPEAEIDDARLRLNLSTDDIEVTCFFNAKRMTRTAAFELGALWMRWASEKHGIPSVQRSKTDWSDPMSFMVAYPEVAPMIFQHFPHVRVMVMPALLSGVGSPIVWVGVSPKSRAKEWVNQAEARMQPEIKINLDF